MPQVSGHSADMPLDIPPVERCWDPTGRRLMMKLLVLLVLGPYSTRARIPNCPMVTTDEATFLHKQDPGDARRVPSSAACLPSL